MKLFQRALRDPNASIPAEWLEQLRQSIAQGPEHAALYGSLLAHARDSGIDKVVQLLDVVESSKGFGHAATRAAGKSIDSDGQPMPWITYPAFHYLDQLDLSSFRVLETGAGNSTLYWGSRCREVVTIEHDAKWQRFVSSSLPTNCRVIVTEESRYAEAFASATSADGLFDLLVIDGRERFACTRAAASKLRPGGFVLLDNAEWYPNCAALLRNAGLIQIDFAGLGPVADFAWTTSIFLHPQFRPAPRSLPFPRVGPGQQRIDAPDDRPNQEGVQESRS
ncbi:MAG: class I SAM-dependent methyltransferase [Phycisphaerales bacterium]|nr:class I SAM-dependent methyltransferase [Phycisphaerales bacterium]